MAESERLTEGSVINDRYVVESHIGTGGYSEVVAARDLSVDHRVALKVLHGEATTHDPRAVDRMRQEAEILRAIDHPNIVRIYEVDTFEQGQFLVMEHVDGVGLDELIERHGPVAPSRLAPVVRQLLDALGAAHDTEILHRDLKPDNILIADGQGGETVKLVDFGVAKAGAVLNADDPEEGITLVKTRAGTFVGTPRYAAPEMVVGDPLSPATDLFCVGLIVYEALVGEPLLEGDSESELLNQLVFPRPFDLEAVPDPWAQWLELLLEKSPDHRIPTCRQALARLDALVESSPRDHGAVPEEKLAAPDQTTQERLPLDDDELHPRFGDSPPPAETQVQGPPDFAALDAAASPDESEDSSSSGGFSSPSDAREPGAHQPDEPDSPPAPQTPEHNPSFDSEPSTSSPRPEDDDDGLDSTESALLFFIIAFAAFVIAGAALVFWPG